MATKGYYTENIIFNDSKFMEELLNNQKKIRFSGYGASHKNGAAERAIKRLVIIERTMLIYSDLIYTKDILYNDFGQQKWNMLYGSTVGSLILSMVYNILDKVYPYMFWNQGCRSLE